VCIGVSRWGDTSTGTGGSCVLSESVLSESRSLDDTDQAGMGVVRISVQVGCDVHHVR
jgi:hypothetical protein